MSDAIVVGAQAGLRVLVDGSVRLTIDIEPKDRVAAMTLFGSPGQSIALAALKDGHAQAYAQSLQPKIRYSDMGPICREAIELCEHPKFQQYIGRAGMGRWKPNADAAKGFILAQCNVNSRKELDTAAGARELFIAHVRKPFHAWLEKNQ